MSASSRRLGQSGRRGCNLSPDEQEVADREESAAFRAELAHRRREPTGALRALESLTPGVATQWTGCYRHNGSRGGRLIGDARSDYEPDSPYA